MVINVIISCVCVWVPIYVKSSIFNVCSNCDWLTETTVCLYE